MPEYLKSGSSEQPRPPSGQQIEIVNGAASAVVTEVGGGLRSFEIAGEPVLHGYLAGELCSGGKGQVLAPWPNRLGDGSYSFQGIAATAALDEPAHANAIHGLVRWLNWRLVEHSPAAATMEVELAPQPGYPWRLTLQVTYALTSETELSVSVRATNNTETEAPFGIGFHPYVHAGPGGVDSCRLALRAERRIVTDERGLPESLVATAGSEYDFAGGRSLRGVQLDDCYSGLMRGDGAPEGAAWSVSVERGDGRVVRVSAGAEFPYLMCFTADTLGAEDRRRGIAVEPMTCPANALASGMSLIVLGREGSVAEGWSGSWQLSAPVW